MTISHSSVPDSGPERLREAWAAFASQEWSKAAALFDALLQDSPAATAAEAAFGLAHVRARMNEHAGVAGVLEPALALARENKEIRLALIRAWTPYGTFGYAINTVKAGLNKATAEHMSQRIALLRTLVSIYEAAGDVAGAISVYYTLISIAPRDAATMTAIGRLWMLGGDNTNAANFFQKALALEPACLPAMDGLADARWIEGQATEVRDILRRRGLASINPEERAAALFKAEIVQPAMTCDANEIDEARARFTAAVAAGPTAPLADPWKLGLGPNFYANYHARPDRALHEAVAAYFLAATPNLGETDLRRRAPAARPRIGMVSAYFCGHTVGYLTRGLILGLDRKRFELVLFRTPGARFDPVTQELAAAAPMINLPPDLPTARRMIAEAGLDVLHFPEVGMDRFAYFLAFARLAPLQTTSWGHPLTTGIPNMDMFLSVDDMEPPNGAAHYSERLVRLRNLSIDVTPPRMEQVTTTRDALGLDPRRPAYVCAQSLYKLHYLFDDTLRLILDRDRDGLLYFVSHSAHADDLFSKRLERSLGKDMTRVRILPRTTPQKFLHLLRAADVLLDVPQWSGGKTSLEGLAMGTPIVHQPGEFMRGRHTLAFLRRLHMAATVVENAEAYAETAARLVHDGAFRHDVRGQIAERSHRLWNDTASVREIETVWSDALAELER